ncbi:MAG: hypothetical protein ACTHPD_04185, partial [Rhizomicrobium sp.]
MSVVLRTSTARRKNADRARARAPLRDSGFSYAGPARGLGDLGSTQIHERQWQRGHCQFFVACFGACKWRARPHPYFAFSPPPISFVILGIATMQFIDPPWWFLGALFLALCAAYQASVSRAYPFGGAFASLFEKPQWQMALLVPAYAIGFVILIPLHLRRYFVFISEAQQMNDLAGRVAEYLRHLPPSYRYGSLWAAFVAGSFRAQLEDERKTSAYTDVAKEFHLAGPISYLRAMVGPDVPYGVGTIYLNAWDRLEKKLPRYVAEPMVFTTALSSVCDSAMIDSFFHAFEREDRMLWSVFSTYTQNWYAARTAIEERIYPKESRCHIEQLIEGTGYETMFSPSIEVPVSIPKELRFEGVWVIAPPGRGKTTLLSRLLANDLNEVRNKCASIILMDSKGDLIDHARRLKYFGKDGELEDRLVLIEPRPDLAINPLDLGSSQGQTLSLCEYILDALLDTETTPKQGAVFRRVLIAMQAIPDANFQTFLAFLKDWRPFEPHLSQLDPDDRDFFLNGSYDGKDYRGTREELHWRIDALMTKVPLLRKMFKATETRIDIAKEMDSGKVIIIDNSAAILGAGSEFFARFFVALVLAAGQQRAGRRAAEKLPCYFYMDECHTVVARDPSTASILQQCRSQKIGLVLAHQQMSQIKLDDVKG